MGLQKLHKKIIFVKCNFFVLRLFGKGIVISNTGHNNGCCLMFYVIFEASIHNRCDFMEKL